MIDSTSSAAEEEDYYIDDFVNHPDIINHPALSILARRDGQLRNAIQRQGVSPRQGIGGILAAASSPFSSLVSLGLGATGALGVAVQSNQIASKASQTDLNSVTTRLSTLEASTSASCASVQATGTVNLVLTNAADTAQMTDALTSGTQAGAGATNAELQARFNLIEAAINSFTVPNC